jgi:hypothetical protein
MNNKTLLIFGTFILLVIYNNNKKNAVKNIAPRGKYSETGQYDQITPMKHDIFKTITLNVLPIILFNLSNKTQLFNSKDIFNSVTGQTIIAIFILVTYHQFIQPYIVNCLPLF